MTRTSRAICVALAVTGCLTAGCIDRVQDSAKNAFSDLTEATFESMAIFVLAELIPGFVAPPQERQGLFPPP